GGFENVAISFNGGKDCTVLLDLFRRAATTVGYAGRLKVVYVRSKDPFPEMESFIQEILGRSDFSKFDLIEYKDCGLKEGFEKFINDSGTKGVLIGVRNTDPYAGTDHFLYLILHILDHVGEIAETDNGWPKFLRIHPILHWSYSDVWNY